MQVHLIDGTYELFRYHFAPGGGHVTAAGQEVGATRGVLRSMLSMVRNEGVTHIAIATDSVIESWRNDLYEGYKNGEGVPEELLSQFPLIEQGLALAGFQVWPMIEYEADDGMAAGAAMAVADTRVERVFICTPDKDLAQCVTSDGRVVQFDRRQEILRDEAGVIEKWGVKPASIPDYLALVGDTADGFPGLKGWGAKSAATLLYRYDHLENIPADSADWDVKVRSAAKLGETLVENVEDAFLFRRIATVDTEGPVIGDVDSLLYEGPKPGWEEFCERIDGQSLLRK
ncbi:MAG: 5'-3' exonuclease [Acidimicrobiales bacterium]|jgi:5'-3' exonuclease